MNIDSPGNSQWFFQAAANPRGKNRKNDPPKKLDAMPHALAAAAKNIKNAVENS